MMLSAYLAVEVVCLAALGVLSAWKNVEYEPTPLKLTHEQRADLARALEKYEQTGRLGNHDPILGWSPPTGEPNRQGLIQWNSHGIRATREYTIQKKTDVLRIATFGDSFTLGADVENDFAWQERLSQLDPEIEVLNFGMGGYGLDQAYLRYLHHGIQFETDIVVIGFMSENIYRNVNVFRPFYHIAYSKMGKPRFLLREGHIELQENVTKSVDDFRRLLDQEERVLAEFGENDYHFQKKYHQGRFDFLPSVRIGKVLFHHFSEKLGNPVETRDGYYNPRSEAYQVTEKIFENFYRAVLEQGALPLIIIYPDGVDLQNYPSTQSARYLPLMKNFDARGFRYIDLMTAFEQYDSQIPVEKLTVGRWGHYSILGNELVAAYVLNYLKEHGLDEKRAVATQIAEERGKAGFRQTE